MSMGGLSMNEVINYYLSRKEHLSQRARQFCNRIGR